jgi:hypothetical protein
VTKIVRAEAKLLADHYTKEIKSLCKMSAKTYVIGDGMDIAIARSVP